jgi:hypothetical protein
MHALPSPAARMMTSICMYPVDFSLGFWLQHGFGMTLTTEAAGAFARSRWQT